MTTRIATNLLIAALLAAPSAFARPVDPAELDSLVAQARIDLDARCALSSEDACAAAR
jgi:hypothetical protein